MINNLVENTNLYSVQKSGTNIKTNEKEIEQVIGMFFHGASPYEWCKTILGN